MSDAGEMPVSGAVRPGEGDGAGGASGGRSELGTRLLVAALGVPLCVLVVWVGGLVFSAGLALLAGVGMWEFVGMFGARAERTGEAAGLPFMVLGVAAAASLPILAHGAGLEAAWAATPVVLLAAGAWALAVRPPAAGPLTAASLTVFGALYLGGLLAFGVPLREAVGSRAGGTLLFFLPVVVTWLSDTAAYFGGRRLGRRPLAPRVSPNKTVAGAVSAVIAGPVVALSYAWILLPLAGDVAIGPGRALLFGVAAALAGIVGDLVESLVKRECGVKDASRILPGHGGILDRLDSMLWVFPVAYLFFVAT
ncbi:MAG TPA: phosphatidate cytidylyltransferase [Gemmatimonadota bacterium]|nr:phosphatidate cytidylyltransferase [Gemmatimonadota bacterium]